ncbi:hypothetical protein ES702_07741 [subsurface metagenome]
MYFQQKWYFHQLVKTTKLVKNLLTIISLFYIVSPNGEKDKYNERIGSYRQNKVTVKEAKFGIGLEIF